MDLDLGAMVTKGQQARVDGFVARARADGLPVLAEGKIADGVPPGGYYITPLMLGPVPLDNPMACDEVFGPVLSVLPFEDEAEAIRIANGTPYGLVAGVWTRDAARSMRVARAMRCGQVFVNGYGAGGGIELPFGGVKKSGHGREKGFEALYEFSASKTIVLNHG
jgi:aldehyde dehydrogenase (NAD+)